MTNTIQIPFFVLLSIAVATSSNSVVGAEMTIQPHVEAGMMYYKFEQSALSRVDTVNGVVTESKIEYSDVLPTLSGGIALVVDRFYVDVYAQKAFDGSDKDNILFGQADTQNLITLSKRASADFDRVAYGISVGYNVTSNWAFYAGYKTATTDLKQTRQVTGTQNFTEVVKFDFEQDGPFLGTSYVQEINKGFLNGGLAGNIAIAVMQGSFNNRDIKKIDPDGTVTPSADRRSFDGDTVGLSVGLEWLGSTKFVNLTYSIGANAYRYDFEADKRDLGDVTETVVNVRVGLSYAF